MGRLADKIQALLNKNTAARIFLCLILSTPVLAYGAEEWTYLMRKNNNDLICDKKSIILGYNSFNRVNCKTKVNDSNRGILNNIKEIQSIDITKIYYIYSNIEFSCSEEKYHLVSDGLLDDTGKLIYKTTTRYPTMQESPGSTMYEVLVKLCEFSGQPIRNKLTNGQTPRLDPLAKALVDAKRMANPVLPSKLESTKMRAERNLFKGKCCTNYDDIYKVYIDFSQFENMPKKDEFETTEQYNKRIEAKKVAAKNGEERCYLFLLGTDAGWARYNADEGTMAFGISYSGAVLLKKELQESDYVGENAFGVKKNIKKIEKRDYTIFFTNADDLGLLKIDDGHYDIPVGSINLGIAEAKDLKNKYAVVILVRPSETPHNKPDTAYFKYSFYKDTPTIDFPYDTQQSGVQFNARIMAAIVIDTSNGNVLKYKSFGGDTGCIGNYEIK